MTATETAPAPKTTRKPKADKPAADKKPAAKADPNLGLRKPQVRILLALAKATGPLTRAQVAEKAPVDQATCVEYLGSVDPAVRAANDTKHFPSLISLKLVKVEDGVVVSDDKAGVSVYTITAAGKAKAEKLKAGATK